MSKILNKVREDTQAALGKNLGLKILAVFIAILLWWVVVNVDDPIQTKKYTVEVNVTNPEVITIAGKSFRVEDNSKYVTITVEARRKVIEEITSSNIVATADMRERQESSVPVRISITGFEGQYVSAEAYPQNIQVNVEETKTKEFPITCMTTGSVRDGYVVADLEVSPQSVEITGPESIVSKINKVVARVDVSELAADRMIETTLIYYDAADNRIDQTHLTSNCDMGVDVNVIVWETKTVEVLFDTSGIVPKYGYSFNGIQYEPQTIKVAAKAEILNELTSIEVPKTALAKTGIFESEKLVLDLSEWLPEGVILGDADASDVVVEILIEQIGTKRFSIPIRSIKVEGLSEEMQLSYGLEQSVVIVFSGTSEVLEVLTEGSFIASIDLSEYTAPGEYKVPILISEQPEGCEYTGDAQVEIVLSEKEVSE